MNRNKKRTYPRRSSTFAINDETIRLIGANSEGNATGLGCFPLRQDLQQRKWQRVTHYSSSMSLQSGALSRAANNNGFF